MISASKLDEIEQSMLNTFNNDTTDDSQNEKKTRKNYKRERDDLLIQIGIYKIENKKRIEENNNLKNNLKDYNEYKYIVDFLKKKNIKSINVLKNRVNSNLFAENKDLKEQLYEKQKEINIINNFISDNDLSDRYNKYKENICYEEEIKRKSDLLKNFNKNILKSKFINFCNYLYINKESIKKEREEKIKNIENKMKKNIIKSKVINILRILNNDNKNMEKVLNKVEDNKKNLKFDNKKIQKSALDSNRSTMTFLSTLYEEKEINKTLSNKDFILAVNEFHKDKNITRMTFLCKVFYRLCNNKYIYNSDIIFKYIYSFQYIKEYQLDCLINNIEKIIKFDI